MAGTHLRHGHKRPTAMMMVMMMVMMYAPITCAQARSVGLSHFIPRWTDGEPPARVSLGPGNELRACDVRSPLVGLWS